MSGLPDPEAEDRERLEHFLAWRRSVRRRPSVSRIGLRWFAYGAGAGVLGVVFVSFASLFTADLRLGGRRLDPVSTPGPTASVQEPVSLAEQPLQVVAPLAERPSGPGVDPGPSAAARAVVEADPEASDRAVALALSDRPPLPERPSLPDRPSRAERSMEPPHISADPVTLPERPILSGRASPSRRMPAVELARESSDVTPPATVPRTKPGTAVPPEPTIAPSSPPPPGLGAHEHDRDGGTRSAGIGPFSHRIAAAASPREPAAQSSEIVTIEGVLPGITSPSPPASSSSRSPVVQPPEVVVKPLPEPIETLKRFVESVPTGKIGKTVRGWVTRDRD
jgi:hypothetical protein